MGVGDILMILRLWGPIVGPILAILIFTFWKDYKREMRLQARVEALEKDQKEVLLPLVERCSMIVAQNTAVMLRLERVLDKIGPVEVEDEKGMLEQLLQDAAAHRRDG